MNINKILPVLFKALEVKTNPQQQSNKNIDRAEVKQSLPSTITKNPPADRPVATAKPQSPGSLEITYLPLPLKSEYYKNALFFVRHLGDGQPGDKEQNSGFFIKLATDNLGTLWIGLETVANKGLIVRMVAENEDYQEAIDAILPAVKQDLEGLDYSTIVTSCIVQPKVHHCQDIDPAAQGLQVITSIMDWRV